MFFTKPLFNRLEYYGIGFISAFIATVMTYAAYVEEPEPPTQVDFAQMSRDLDTIRLQQLEVMAQLKLMNGLALSQIAGEIEEKVR